jgi:hypothetical protein
MDKTDSDNWKPDSPNPYLNARNIVLGVAILLVLTFFTPVMRLLAPKELGALRRELTELPPPPNSRIIRTKESPSWDHILLERSYKSPKTYDDLKQYYGRALEAKGWRLKEENNLRDFARGVDIRELLFCKPPYASILHYDGEKPEQAETFTLSLSWGLHSICNSKPSN